MRFIEDLKDGLINVGATVTDKDKGFVFKYGSNKVEVRVQREKHRQYWMGFDFSDVCEEYYVYTVTLYNNKNNHIIKNLVDSDIDIAISEIQTKYFA